MAAMTESAQRPVRLARLKKRHEFLTVARKGKKHAAKGVVLQALRRDLTATDESPAPDSMRVGFTVTRKVGGAVIRNRIKRRLRALADTVLARHGQDGWDYVLIGRVATKDRSFKDLEKDLMNALKGVGAYRDGSQ